MAATRIALVIGNSDYAQLGTLPNPKNDARAINQALSDLGFSSRLVLDATEQTLRREIIDFSARSEGASTALVYYAGHGAQVAGENYLIPVDMDTPKREADIQFSAIKVNDLISSIKSNVKLVFLDACRDNPVLYKYLSKGRGASYARGLAPVRAEQAGEQPEGGIFIAFATGAGDVAVDGKGEHSPFTEALLRYIHKPISIDDMFSLVTRDVREATHNAQRPYKYASLETIVCLPPSCGRTPSEPKARARIGESQIARKGDAARDYRLALAGNDVDELQRIAAKYPDSATGEAAQEAVARIQSLFPDTWLLFGVTPDKKLNFYFRPSSYRSGNGRVWIDVRITTGDAAAPLKQTNTTVFDCSSKTFVLSRVENYSDEAKLIDRAVYGDPRVVPIDPVLGKIAAGSINESLLGITCPPRNPGRILSRADLKSQNWQVIMDQVPSNAGLGRVQIRILHDSIKVSGNEVRAIVWEETARAASDWVVPYSGNVVRQVVRCDKGELAAEDADLLAPNGEIVGKLLPINAMKWSVPRKGSLLEGVVDSLCLSAAH